MNGRGWFREVWDSTRARSSVARFAHIRWLCGLLCGGIWHLRRNAWKKLKDSDKMQYEMVRTGTVSHVCERSCIVGCSIGLASKLNRIHVMHAIQLYQVVLDLCSFSNFWLNQPHAHSMAHNRMHLQWRRQ